MIYFRLYIENFDGATLDLSMLEDGAYNRLMRFYYRTELPLPLDSDRLARVCRAITLEERAAIAAVLDRYFLRRPDGWHNERADHEIKVSKIARDNGSRGGRPAATDDETESQTVGVTGAETEGETGTGTRERTRKGGKSGQPISLLTNTTLLPSQPSIQNPSAHASRGGRTTPRGDTVETWGSYRQAYFDRYGVEPVRNARVNGQMASVVRCVGAAEAPHIAAFYVRHNRQQYVAAKHSSSLLARDVEGLRTEWATNRPVTETEARQSDRTQATATVFTKLIGEAL